MSKGSRIRVSKTVLTISISLIIGMVFFHLVELYTFDHFFHLETAKHYLQNPFSIVQISLNVGRNVTTYPPLGHLILSRMSNYFGLFFSIRVLSVIGWVFLSYNVSKFFIEFIKIDETYFPWIYFFVFFTSGFFEMLFTYGQFTTLLGFGFGFLASRILIKCLREKIYRNYLFFALSFSIVGFTHHFSFIIFSIFFVLLFISETEFLDVYKFKWILFSLFLVFIIILGGLNPFLNSLLEEPISGVEITHNSRESIFTYDRDLRVQWIYSDIGLAAIGLISPLVFIKIGMFSGGIFKIWIISLLFLVLGLGRTTFLPEIIFGDLFSWLTYERFIIFSGLLLSGITGYMFAVIKENYAKFGKKLFVLTVLVYFLFNFGLSLQSYETFHGTSMFDIDLVRLSHNEFILSYLESNSTGEHRFQTLGYGYRISELTILSGQSTTDTEYYQGRNIDWLNRKGQPKIDRINPILLDKFFDEADENGLKHVFAFESDQLGDYPLYLDILEPEGFEKVKDDEIELTGNRVTVWENKNLQEPTHLELTRNYAWTLVPITVLIIFFTAYLWPENSLKKVLCVK